MDSTQIKTLYKFGLLFIKNNRILLCEPFAFKDLILPGGIKENNETFIENLNREVKEELGNSAKLDLDSLEFIGKFSDFAAGRINVIVEIDLYSGVVQGKLKPSSEIKKLIWFNPKDDWVKLSPIIKNQIMPFLLDKKYIYK